MKKKYLDLFMEVTQYEEKDIVRTSTGVYGTDGTDDFGYDFWD